MAKSGWKASGMTRRLGLVLSGLAGAVLLFAQADPVIRVNVQLVRILATVKDSGGGLVGSLEKSDFAITDNGKPQEIAVFERQTEQPLSIAILIDNSGSTAKDLKYETDSVTRFARALFKEGNPGDSAALFSFNWEIVKQSGYTRNALDIERRLKLLKGEAGTALYDAILLASRDIESRRGRKVLVIVTDGGDTISKTTFDRALEAAQLADVVIYPILVMPITNDAGRNIGGENALATLAQRTGGHVFQPTLGAALDQSFTQILRELRTQYLIGFYPKDVPLNKERFHSLGVKTVVPELKVTARSGYYGEVMSTEVPAGRIDSNADETMRPRRPAVVKKPGS